MHSAVSASDFSRSAGMPPTDLGGEDRVDAALQRGERYDRRRAAQAKRAIPVGGPVVRREVERRGVARASRQRLAELQCIHPRRVRRMGPDERRGAGTAVQVLVAAAHGEIGGSRPDCPPPFNSTGTAPAECDRSQTTSAPAAWAARLSVGHRMHAAVAIVDVRKQAAPPRGRSSCATNCVGLDRRKSTPRSRRDALGDVEIGRKIARAPTG